jgi:serine/threonine protein kinase
MSSAELADYQDTFPPEKRPKCAKTLARELVRDEKLTPYQLEAILAGKAALLALGEYVILGRIGEGGMGEVFKAIHRRLKRLAAVKMLRPDTLKSAAAVQRFYQEAKVAALLSHPNIVATYDASEQDGVPYLVMEYVEGCDLATLIKRYGSIALCRALDYVLQAARGLEYAHHRNVLHRDVKPANLLLATDGTVKISDMGLARIIEEEMAGPRQTLAQRLTRQGQMLGTVDYISPEQAVDTRHVDHRADIYSLGCTLCTILTGKPLYEGDTPMAKLLAHCEGPGVSLRDRLPDVPEQLDEVFMKMVAKQVADRYQTMTEVIEHLQACLDAQLLASRQGSGDGRTANGRAPPSPTAGGPLERKPGAAEPVSTIAGQPPVIHGSDSTVELVSATAALEDSAGVGATKSRGDDPPGGR